MIRPYQTHDFDACLTLFDSNCPPYFIPEERQPYIDWLQKKALDGRYFVLEKDQQVLACGGWYWDNDADGLGLSWGMVHQDHHKKGLGTTLTHYRIQAGLTAFPKAVFRLCTSQYTEAFYQRMGFVTQKITPNGFGEGLDRYDMTASKT